MCVLYGVHFLPWKERKVLTTEFDNFVNFWHSGWCFDWRITLSSEITKNRNSILPQLLRKNPKTEVPESSQTQLDTTDRRRLVDVSLPFKFSRDMRKPLYWLLSRSKKDKSRLSTEKL